MGILKSKNTILCILLLFAIGFQNCSDVEFERLTGPSCSPDPNNECHQTALTLMTIQPAVAVRGISCLLCHSKIHANVITDFGRGNPWYWGGEAAKVNSASWYNNYVNTWQTAEINGNVYVPDDLIPLHIQDSVTEFANLAPMTTLEFMTTPYIAPKNWSKNTTQQGVVEMSNGISPINDNKLIAKNKILISSPNEEDISLLATKLWNSTDSSGLYRRDGVVPSQFIIKGARGATYVTNREDQVLQCKNVDIVIKGTLLLRNLKINASVGCRLYVSGSVFIEGPIEYQSAGNQNIQITSANGIFMGFSNTTLTHRLIDDFRGLEIAGSRTYIERANQAVQEAINIGDLRDAKDNQDESRTSIDYSALLLNAPLIHSRYLGVFKGTIIAQAAIFAIGQFHFEFDPVFTRVNVFPLLKEPILSIK